eukprot:211919-Prorocentrum_minimum.AAC.4
MKATILSAPSYLIVLSVLVDHFCCLTLACRLADSQTSRGHVTLPAGDLFVEALLEARLHRLGRGKPEILGRSARVSRLEEVIQPIRARCHRLMMLPSLRKRQSPPHLRLTSSTKVCGRFAFLRDDSLDFIA